MVKDILVVGTGTIGEPLIGLLADFRKNLNLPNIMFHKRTPLRDEVAKVESLVRRGAKLVVDPEKVEEFKSLGHEPALVYQEALELCDVVIDCTPAGNIAKKEHYLPLLKKYKNKIFIAQGSEKGFGLPYAFGINDEALLKHKDNFIQVVSCNTHNVSSLVDTLSSHEIEKNFVSGDFTCIRRSNDISQHSGFSPSPEVGAHKDSSFGTHHAKDSYDLFKTLGFTPNLFSSAMKLNTQYMHVIRFNVEVRGFTTREDVVQKFKDNKFTAITYKNLANKVFSFGRDHGYYGRIFNHTVVAAESLNTRSQMGNTIISGFCFTPQDGNSLLSSVSAALYGIHGVEYPKHMKFFDKFLFGEI
jgi:glyceraldehyde-3-phosphate dehydrogenase/erythrose-4-phosphate dehydrogenase